MINAYVLNHQKTPLKGVGFNNLVVQIIVSLIA